jgi:hypothetical protein
LQKSKSPAIVQVCNHLSTHDIKTNTDTQIANANDYTDSETNCNSPRKAHVRTTISTSDIKSNVVDANRK